MVEEDSILLHPDALHCLKRKQLVSLCRRLDIKANGKNADLIARLQAFATANIAPDSPTKGNLALLRHVRRPRPSYHESNSDEEDAPDDDNHPAPSGEAETVDFDAAPRAEESQSLRRSPRKRNVNSLQMESKHPIETQPLRPRSVKGPRPYVDETADSSCRQRARPTSAHAQVADLSLDIDRMLMDIHTSEPDAANVHDCEVEDVTDSRPTGLPEPQNQTGNQLVESCEPYMAEFGSMAAIEIHTDSRKVSSSSIGSKSSSSTASSPWKALSGSLKGLKNGLQRMGSLSKGTNKKTVGEKRRRLDADIGSKGDDGPLVDEEVGDRSMPGAFEGSVQAPAAELLVEPNHVQANVVAQSQTQPLRIIKPRPSRTLASHGPVMVLTMPASPSRLYPDLGPLVGSQSSSPAPLSKMAVPLPSAPSISSQQFSAAAASVLAEMNARLAAAGRSTTSISTLGGTGQWSSSTTSLKDLGLSKGKATRFDNQHDKHFRQMDSIANHYAAKRPRPITANPAGASSGINGQSPNRGSMGPSSRMVSGPSSSSLANASGPKPAALSTAPSSKRLRVSEDPGRPGLSTAASSRSIAGAGMPRSTTATSLSSTAQREMQRRRLELARQRRLSKGIAGSTSASALASAKAKERGRLERLKTGIREMIHGGSSCQSSTAAIASKPETLKSQRKVNDSSIGSAKSAVSASSALSASSSKAPAASIKKRPVFDLKASLSRKPSSTAPSQATLLATRVAKPNNAESVSKSAAMADRLRTQGWTGTTSANPRVRAPTAEAARPATAPAREFGSVRTNTASISGTSRAMPSSVSTGSLAADGQKKVLIKAAKPSSGAKRSRVQPDRLLQRKREAIAQAAVKTTMLASSSSMDIARRTVADENRRVAFPSSASGASFTGPSNGATTTISAGGVAQQQQSRPLVRKISSRTMSNPAVPRGVAASSAVLGPNGAPASSVAESMRAARLAELRARNRAAEAGIGLGRTPPSPIKSGGNGSTAGSGLSGGITSQNRFTLLQNSPNKLASRVGPTLTPRSSSLRNLRRMMRSAGKAPSSGLRTLLDEKAERNRTDSNPDGIRIVQSDPEPVPTPTASPVKVAAIC